MTQQPTSDTPEPKTYYDDPYSEFGGQSLDIEKLLDDLVYPGNAHETIIRLTSSLLSRGKPADEAITFICDAIEGTFSRKQ